MISKKKSLNDESLVNESCDFTKKFSNKYALLKLKKKNPRRLANPEEVSTDSNSLSKIKNIILNTFPRTLAP